MRPSTADVRHRDEKEDEAGVGCSLAEFKIMGELGKGAYGVVYRVLSLKDGKEYVLKKIPIKHLKRSEIQDVVREAKLLRKVENQYIIKSFSHFVEAGALNIIMEYAEGGDLQKYIKSMKKNSIVIGEVEIWRIAEELTQALVYLHDNRIIHRDIKTLNVFLTKDHRVKLGDLGVSKIVRNSLAAENTRVGTPLYLAPELVKQKPYEYKIDVWALGCILYQMCTGKAPFSGENLISLGYNIVHNQPGAIPSTFSNELIEFINKLLEKNPAIRPSSAEALNMIQVTRKSSRPTLLAKNHSRHFEASSPVQGINVGPGAGALIDLSPGDDKEGPRYSPKRSPKRAAPAVLGNNKGTLRGYLGNFGNKTEGKKLSEVPVLEEKKEKLNTSNDAPLTINPIAVKDSSSLIQGLPKTEEKHFNQVSIANLELPLEIKPGPPARDDSGVNAHHSFSLKSPTPADEYQVAPFLIKEKYQNIHIAKDSPIAGQDQVRIVQNRIHNVHHQNPNSKPNQKERQRNAVEIYKTKASGSDSRPQSAVLGPRAIPSTKLMSSQQDKVKCTDRMLKRAMMMDPIHNMLKNKYSSSAMSAKALEGVEASGPQGFNPKTLDSDRNTSRMKAETDQSKLASSSMNINDTKQQKTSLSNLQTSAIDFSDKNRLTQAQTAIQVGDEHTHHHTAGPVTSFHPFLDPYRQVFTMGTSGKVEHRMGSKQSEEDTEAVYEQKRETFKGRQRPQTASANLHSPPKHSGLSTPGSQYHTLGPDFMGLEQKRNYRIKTANAGSRKDQQNTIAIFNGPQNQIRPLLGAPDFVLRKITVHDI